MDAVKFLEVRKEMCVLFECSDCPLFDEEYTCKLSTNCDGYEAAVKIAEEWVKNHPAKTRQSEFLELLPNAKCPLVGGVVDICPKCIDSTFECRNDFYTFSGYGCSSCRRDYWLMEVE